jgi:hypothetical protein
VRENERAANPMVPNLITAIQPACNDASDPSRDGTHRQRTQVGAAAAFASASSAALGAAMDAFFVGCGNSQPIRPNYRRSDDGQ